MLFGNKVEFDQDKKKKGQERLQELRKKQGSDVEYYKDELMTDLKLDRKKAYEINGKIDKKTYNV